MTEAREKTTPAEAVAHKDMANAIRALAMDAVQAAKSGHPGMPMGMADVATVLFREFLRFDASDPKWPNRDRFVLSAGHGSMLLYALLYLTGYPGMSIDELKNFRQLGSKTAGHPEYGHAPGIETTTGPLGQGLANAVGMALAERMLNARLGSDVIDHYTYAIAGDGCLMEGISHEAISLAGHLGLGKLIVLFDDNGISIDGSTSLAVSDDQPARFKASGWNAVSVDGHDPQAIAAAIAKARADSSKPWLIACKTTIGFGAPTKAGKSSTHGEPLGEEEIKGTREKLHWPYPPFVVPEAVLSAWRAVGERGSKERAAWKARVAGNEAATTALSGNAGATHMPDVVKAIAAAKSAFAGDEAKRATRVWSQMTLERVVPVLPELLGGSADLTGSNGTRTKLHTAISKGDFSGNYIHYGVREHAMGAMMNGIALNGGFIPYGGTFLVFTDYARAAIRLSSLMRLRVIYVMTHDSIGLGEDGPTHQPIEHLAALRAVPHLIVMRPADGVETAECWEIALLHTENPSILALSRQAVMNVHTAPSAENKSAKGAYVLTEPEGGRDVTLMATGAELGIAVDAADALAKEGVRAAVVSMPSMELFRAQDASYRAQVLGIAPRVAIEAGVAQPWYEWLGENGRFVGLSDFGASAPAPQLFEHFGLTAKHVTQTVHGLLEK
ncbi:MAG TPA: transketolase [Hyphomicrobium sp.]